MKFTKTKLDSIAELLCNALEHRLRGEPTASDFNAAINLLRNNGIMATSSSVGSLTETLLNEAEEDLFDEIPTGGDHYNN